MTSRPPAPRARPRCRELVTKLRHVVVIAPVASESPTVANSQPPLGIARLGRGAGSREQVRRRGERDSTILLRYGCSSASVRFSHRGPLHAVKTS